MAVAASLALRDLGQPVRALVRDFDDAALVMAQGQENGARRDLSFIEKANFA
jgi:ParB family transcriptional regulator, chromosome partitioning protein